VCALEVTSHRHYTVLEYSDEKGVNIHKDWFAYKVDMRLCCDDACIDCSGPVVSQSWVSMQKVPRVNDYCDCWFVVFLSLTPRNQCLIIGPWSLSSAYFPVHF